MPAPPGVLPPASELVRELEDARRNWRAIDRDRHLYHGEFVIACDGKVVAHHYWPNQAWALARKTGVNLDDCVVDFVPQPGTSIHHG